MTDRIEREMDLPASPARVWRSLTDPDQAARWLADEVMLELWPGGEASFRIGERQYLGWVEEVRPPAGDRSQDGGDGGRELGRLTFWWAQDGEPASRVELVLYPGQRDGTRLRIVETRPLETLDLVGIPLPGQGGARFGPALVAA
jgi:uncharacterized protein YndB with AHSA1/START domain